MKKKILIIFILIITIISVIQLSSANKKNVKIYINKVYKLKEYNNLPKAIIEVHNTEEFFTITASSSGNGKVSPISKKVPYGSSTTISIDANPGYTIKSIIVNGIEQTTPSTSRAVYLSNGYTFSNIISNHSIYVTFSKDVNNNQVPDDEESYTITTITGTNGKATPATQTVEFGGTGFVDFIPNKNYTIKSLIVDDDEKTISGVSRANFVYNPYAFADVKSNHIINVSFGEDNNHNDIPDDEESYTITTITGINGIVNPTTQTIKFGGTGFVEFIPNKNYTIKSLIVDGNEKTISGVSRANFIYNPYTFSNVKSNHIIIVSFAEDNNHNNIPDDEEIKEVIVYRMYNPVTGEHLYTTDAHEVEVIFKEQGWGKEGIGWYTSNFGTPVYRLYNPSLGNHLYTSDTYEISVITKQGWVLDFDGQPVMYSSGDVPIYRLFNPGLKGQHHLTTDRNEYNVIPKWGWQQEGIAMHALKMGVPETTYYYK